MLKTGLASLITIHIISKTSLDLHFTAVPCRHGPNIAFALALSWWEVWRPSEVPLDGLIPTSWHTHKHNDQKIDKNGDEAYG